MKLSKKEISSLKIENNNPIASWMFVVNDNKEEVQKISLVPFKETTSELESKIAPGSSGSFVISIDATESEVDLKYYIKSIEETNKPHNFKFIFNDKEYDYFHDMEEILTGIINTKDENKTRTFEIKWEWKYETGNTLEEIYQNNLKDTQDMQNIKSYDFTIFVSGEQVEL